MFGEGLNALLNTIAGREVFPSPTRAAQQLMTQAGLPEPQTARERVVQDVTSGMAGVGGTAAMLRPLGQAAAPLTERLGLQTAGAIGAAGAAGMGREEGAGPLGQLGLAALGGTIAPGTMATAAGRGARGAVETVRPFTEAGREVIAGNVLRQLSAQPEAAITSALAYKPTIPGYRPTSEHQRRGRPVKLKRGSTSIRRLIFVGDSSSTTGAGLANLLHNTSGLVAYYFAGDLSNEVSIPLASATLGSYTDGGFVAVDNTNMPGWYEFGIPNGALDGGNEVAIQLRGAANMVPVNVYIELDTVDYQTDAFGAIKPTTAGRTLDISAGGEAGIDLANVGSPSTTLNLSGTTIKTATDIETDTQDIQNRLPSGLVDGRMRSIAEVVGDKTNYKLASDGLSLVTSWAVGITGNITGNLSGSVGSVTGNVGGNVTGSVGSISGVTFPTNFDALGINSSGHLPNAFYCSCVFETQSDCLIFSM